MANDAELTTAIELVSHEVRADILIELARQQRDHPDDQTLRFSELRDRVGHDDPGNFNYHLKRLVGTLVERTEAGYRLSDVGHRFVAVLRSGRFDPDVSKQFPEYEPPCLFCDDRMAVEYEDGLLRTACENGHESRLNVGPELLDDRPIEGVLNAALCRSLLEGRAFLDGICPFCDGPTTGGLRRISDGPVPVAYDGHCERCGALLHNTVGGCVLFHPAAVSFYHRHDLDVFQQAWTAMATTVGDPTVLEEEPLRVSIELAIDDGILELELDRDASVRSVRADSTGE